MADKNLLNVLSHGAMYWNSWLCGEGRAAAESLHSSHLDLSRAPLEGVNLRGARLNRVNLHEAHLQRTDLSGAILSHSDLSHAHLQSANLQDTAASANPSCRSPANEPDARGAAAVPSASLSATVTPIGGWHGFRSDVRARTA